MMRLLHVVVFLVVSILVSDRDGQGGVFKVMRMIVFSVFSRLSFFPQLFGQVKGCLY